MTEPTLPTTEQNGGTNSLPGYILMMVLVGGGSVTGSQFLDNDDDLIADIQGQITTATREEPAQWSAIKGNAAEDKKLHAELKAELSALKEQTMTKDEIMAEIREEVELFYHRNIRGQLEALEDNHERSE